MFETFDHTADLGLRVRAESLDELFAEAGRGLISIMIENVEAIEPRDEMHITIAGSDREYLLFDWLKELLYRFDAEHRLFGEFEVQVSADGLTATTRGEPLDWERHVPNHEVKAITYHRLKVARENGAWVAEVIVDI